MKSYIILGFLLAITLQVEGTEEVKIVCKKPGEVCTPCLNPCPATCLRPNPPQCKPIKCTPGCQCEEPLVRTKCGDCVLASQCPKDENPCKEGEVLVDCLNPCPATCERPNPPLCKAVKCIPGCQCRKDLVKTKEGKCVKPCLCPKCD